MRHYPIFLNLKGRKVLVFGGGEVALRKIKTLLACGAKVEAISRDYCVELVNLARRNPRLVLRHGGSGNCDSCLKSSGVRLVFAATSDRIWNRRIAQECRKKGIWVNTADDPALCDFLVPSSLKKGSLEIAISTGGRSPLLARKFREELSRKIRPAAVRFVDRMEKFRREAFRKLASQKKRKHYFEMKAGKDFQFLANGNGSSR